MVDGRVLVQLMVDMKSLLGGERLAWLISAYILRYLKKKRRRRTELPEEMPGI